MKWNEVEEERSDDGTKCNEMENIRNEVEDYKDDRPAFPWPYSSTPFRNKPRSVAERRI